MADATTAPDVYVALRLRGDFTPAMVTRQLGLSPSHVLSEGEVVGNGGSGRVHPHSTWLLESRSIDADTIEPHLDWLLNLIEPLAGPTSALLAAGIHGDVHCYWSSIGTGGGPWISPRSMTRLGALGLPLVVSFYVTDPL
jgi:hypothetical protein